ncbi:hypothetical protein ACFX13_003874 [Malus domestica]
MEGNYRCGNCLGRGSAACKSCWFSGKHRAFSISSDKFRVLQEPNKDRKMFKSLSLNRLCIALAESYKE